MDVLLVDDEAAFVERLAERLRLRGYSVRTAGTAEDALAVLAEHPCDIAFLDVGLPGMDGLSLLGKIRAALPGLACCMLTGAAQVEVAAKALRQGAFDWLAKPVRVEEVEAACKRAGSRLRRLREQHLMAEAARIRSLDRLTHGVAHEVNNPVNIMVQAAGDIEDLLQEKPLKDLPEPLYREISEELATIRRQSRRVRELTQTLLLLGGGGSGDRCEAVHPDAVVKDVLALFTGRMQQLGVRAKMDMAQPLPDISGSSAEMRQILLHLVENALDAMPQGGTLRLSVRAVPAASVAAGLLPGGSAGDEKKGSFIEIAVADTGSGIPAEQQEEIFEPFYTTRDVGQGSGLGLTVCRSLVEKRGGSIRVQSVPGNTVFTLLVPAAGTFRDATGQEPDVPNGQEKKTRQSPARDRAGQ